MRRGCSESVNVSEGYIGLRRWHSSVIETKTRSRRGVGLRVRQRRRRSSPDDRAQITHPQVLASISSFPSVNITPRKERLAVLIRGRQRPAAVIPQLLPKHQSTASETLGSLSFCFGLCVLTAHLRYTHGNQLPIPTFDRTNNSSRMVIHRFPSSWSPRSQTTQPGDNVQPHDRPQQVGHPEGPIMLDDIRKSC